MKIRDILPVHVRQWVTKLSAAGVSPAQVRHLKIILSAVFTTALNDFVVLLHPCKGVKTPTVPVKGYRILTPAEFEALLAALPSDTARLFIEVSMGSGLRWGELIEMRPTDLHVPLGHHHGDPRGGRAQPALPPDRGTVPGQAVPEEQALPPLQTRSRSGRIEVSSDHEATHYGGDAALTTRCDRHSRTWLFSRLLDRPLGQHGQFQGARAGETDATLPG